MLVSLLVVFYLFYFANLADLWFASKINDEAIAALQLVFPLWFLLLSFQEAIHIATNNLLSIYQWKKNFESQSKVFWMAVIFAVFSWIFFVLFGPWITKLYLSLFDLSAIVLSYAYEYIVWYFCLSIWFLLAWVMWAVFVVYHKYTWQVVYGILYLVGNVVFNYILVFKLNLWVKWLAIATNIVYGFLVFVFLVKYVLIDKFFSKWNLDWWLAKQYMKYWLGAFLSMVVFVFEFFVNNYFSGLFSEYAIAAYGIVAKLLDTFTFVIFASVIAFSTIYGYFWWAKDVEMLKYVESVFVKYFVLYLIVAGLLIWLAGKYFVLFFTVTAEILNYSEVLIKVISIFIIAMGLNYVYSNIFQVIWYHWLRVIFNVILVALIGLFEWIGYWYWGKFEVVWLGWLIAQVVVTAVVWGVYRQIGRVKSYRVKMD